MKKIGIIGLGEAGTEIAKGLATNSDVDVVGYDVRQDSRVLQEWASRTQIRLARSVQDLVRAADISICLTSATAALSIVTEAVPSLTQGKIYADFNSAGPRLKEALAGLVRSSGALFVDGAVMSAVVPHGHRVPVLLSGDGAVPFEKTMRTLGANLEVIGELPGQAAAIKIFRSLLVKGLEALMLECLIGAAGFGIGDRVLQSMGGSLPFDDWEQLANYLTGRTVLHGERRAAELRQVADTLVESGIEPLIAEAGAIRLEWAANCRLLEHFGGKAPDDYQSVVEFLRSPSIADKPQSTTG